MQETEVVDDPIERADTARRAHVRATRVEQVAVALLIVSAALCVAAPFRQLYVLHFPFPGTDPVDIAVDGWGRYSPLGDVAHGPRYGIALCAVAALLLAIAMLRIRALVRGSSASRARGLLPATVGVLTGVLGTVLIDVQNSTDNFNEHINRADAGPGAEAMTVGWGLWLTVIAWAAALIGSALPSVMGRRRGDA